VEIVDAAGLDVDFQRFVLVLLGDDIGSRLVRSEAGVGIAGRDTNDFTARRQLCLVPTVDDHGSAGDIADFNDFEGNRAFLDGHAIDGHFAGNPAASPRRSRTVQSIIIPGARNRHEWRGVGAGLRTARFRGSLRADPMSSWLAAGVQRAPTSLKPLRPHRQPSKTPCGGGHRFEQRMLRHPLF